ncbi:MAG: peptidase MA family metallohydrolase [bacterium]
MMRSRNWLAWIHFGFLSFLMFSDASAQYYFGRNKIQYDNFDWKILKTEHFDVYFYPEMRELAEIGAAFAEEAYHRLEGVTNHNITRRIPLIFYSNHSHFQQTNTIPNFISEGVGGFFEFIKGRVVIPSTGSIHDFKHVINHELVHVFTRSKMNRVYKNHRRNLFASLPLWFTEGLAEYWSEGWSSQAEMFIRDAVLSGYLVPLSEMDRIYGTFLMYKEGQAICKYIAENFGEQKLLQLYENAWKESSFSDVMKLTIGLNYKEFDRKWIYDLKKNKYPLLEENDAPYMVTRKITEQGINTKPAYFRNGDEEWVAFVSNRLGYSNIYAKPLERGRGETEVLVKGERSSDFEAFYLLKSKIDVNEAGELTFVSKSGARDALYIFNLEAGEISKKFDFKDLVSLSSPNWSPDGDRIVFSGISFSGLSDLYIVDLETESLRRLTNDFYDDRDPAWSPNGSAIAFSSDRSYNGKNGHKSLFVYDIQSGQILQLTEGACNDYSPAWSPDGQKLAFASDRDGGFNIWMIKNNAVEIESAPITEVFVASLTNQRIEAGLGAKRANDEMTTVSYPSALELTDELKKITRFTTGAQDPEWIDDNRLLFTAFQDFSFQIRQINDIDEKFEQAPVVANDTLVAGGDYWTANKLAGDVQSTTIKYKKKFNLDIAQSAISHDPVFGATGGAQLAMSDMLGNQQYYFLVYNNAQRSSDFLESWNIAVTRVDLAGRVNYAIGGYRISGRFFDRVDSFFEQDRIGGFVSASYPLSVFNRIEGSVNVRKERREYDIRGKTVDGIVISNTLSYVKDNSLWGITGPIDGERFNFTVGHTLDVQNNDVSFFTFITDYRRYFRLSRRTSYAMRLMGRFNLGKESFRYFMGGSWDLRLYPRWRIWGRKLFLVNNELRFPFLDRLILRFPFGGMGFNGIQGATFLDLGQAWDRDYEFNEVLGSLGFGLRLRFGGFLVLRYEIGRRFQIRDFSSPHIHWDKGLKKAFWFGFDF